MARGASSSLCLDTPDLCGRTGCTCETLQSARRVRKVDASTGMTERRGWRRAQRLPGQGDGHGSWCPWGHGRGVAPAWKQRRGERETPVSTEREGSAGHGAAVGRPFAAAWTTVHVFSHTFLRAELFRDLPPNPAMTSVTPVHH